MIAPGHVCPVTGRVAVLVADYANSDLNGDAPAYWYEAKLAEWGADPWRLVEGVDPHTNGSSFDVCFANGTTATVGPLMTFFLSAKDAARLARRAAGPAGYLASNWVLLRWVGGKASEAGRFARWNDADAAAQKIAGDTSIEAVETWERVKQS